MEYYLSKNCLTALIEHFIVNSKYSILQNMYLKMANILKISGQAVDL